MKTQYGRAGFSTKFLWYKKGKNELVALLMGFLILLIISVFILGLSTYDMRFIIVILGVAPLIFYDILRRFQKLHKLSKRSIKGAKGEEEVGRILSKLPETYVVFHDIKSPYGNIDHVVFDGLNNIVFLIETKAYNGNV
ncbi:MAG TPA: hypothetical protein DIT36_07065, partial [Aquificaceae bacterium]|nr:hypothetical protein [Aquificaceae bacterium]